MKPNRQQKRKMLRDLNNPAKVKKMIERNDGRIERELNDKRNKRKRKLAVVAIAILAALIGAAFILG